LMYHTSRTSWIFYLSCIQICHPILDIYSPPEWQNYGSFFLRISCPSIYI
jgi:hypothetical protein